MNNCFLLATLLFVTLSAKAQVIAIKAGKLIDSNAGKVLENEIILVKDGKVSAVGNQVAIPAGAKLVDLSRKTVCPA